MFEWINELEITVSGGFAVYAIMCVLHVTFVGFTGVLGWVIKNLP